MFVFASILRQCCQDKDAIINGGGPLVGWDCKKIYGHDEVSYLTIKNKKQVSLTETKHMHLTEPTQKYFGNQCHIFNQVLFYLKWAVTNILLPQNFKNFSYIECNFNFNFL